MTEQNKAIEQIAIGLIDNSFTSVCLDWIKTNKSQLPKVGDNYFTSGRMESGKGRFYYIEGKITYVGEMDKDGFVEVYIELSPESKISYWGAANELSRLKEENERLSSGRENYKSLYVSATEKSTAQKKIIKDLRAQLSAKEKECEELFTLSDIQNVLRSVIIHSAVRAKISKALKRLKAKKEGNHVQK